ncbi:melanin-concentrating hormone receptor 2 [Athene cunicularia]|uniref:melanin-concentrating hormone receptor 2 n=1 Tax=Athene cunicularia TaxID=194338 RepID=UPI000EF641A4|nr:melanin-concentrating hormone receptor 2 [Athene cunicularia]
MSEFQPSCQNRTPGLFNSSWSGWHLYQVISAAETIILPSLIGVICSTGLGGNILTVFTVIRTQKKTLPDTSICNLAIADLSPITGMPFLIHQWAHGGKWVFIRPLHTIITSLDTCNQFTCSVIITAMFGQVTSLILMFPVWVYSKVIKFKGGLKSCTFDLTSPDDVLWYTLYLTITTFFFPLPLILTCYIFILCYMWNMYQQNKKARSIPRQRVMRLTTTVLALIMMSAVSIAPFHVIQFMNLQVSQPALTFCMSYYISICLSSTSSNINPFLYIRMSGNSQKHLQWCTNVEVRVAEWDVNVIENTLQSSF